MSTDSTAASTPGDGPAGDEYDVVVIGGGPAGENVAQYAHEGGLSVALIDAELFGGECSYYACMPSKALLRPLDVAVTTQHLPGVEPTRVDRDALLARRDAWVSHYDDASQLKWAQQAGLTAIRGRARLAGESIVEVDDAEGASRRLSATQAVVLATGSVPSVPEVFRDLEIWGSRDATGVREVPQRLLVVGGGVIACEAATWMAALGSQVTMLVRGSALLAGQEPFAGAAVAESLSTAGVRLVFDADVSHASREGARSTGLGRVHGGPVTVSASGVEYVADEVLVATGRRPAREGLGLEAIGLSAQTDPADYPQWLHAIGDAGVGAPLTHMGKYEARVLGAQLAGLPDMPAPREVPVPQVVFTDPQVAAVGLTEASAHAQGLDIAVAEVPYSSAAGTALLRDDSTGRAKLVVDARDGRVLGATFVGHEAAELVHAATIAIVGEVPVRVLRHAVPSYPTSSELWLRLLEELPVRLRAEAR